MCSSSSSPSTQPCIHSSLQIVSRLRLFHVSDAVACTSTRSRIRRYSRTIHRNVRLFSCTITDGPLGSPRCMCRPTAALAPFRPFPADIVQHSFEHSLPMHPPTLPLLRTYSGSLYATSIPGFVPPTALPIQLKSPPSFYLILHFYCTFLHCTRRL
ncbi:hypothetical protein BC628DRAFT_456712 [Trametes gibbosa]|nr:hypothetical protein BC628DRAFT_456712 [Trametes gibbosa]